MINQRVTKKMWLSVGTVMVIAGTGAMAIFNGPNATLQAAAQTTTVGKHTTSKYQKYSAKVMIKTSAKRANKKAYDLTGGTPGKNQPVNFKTKYQLSKLSYITVNQRMNVDNAVYYHFTTTSGQSGWVWRGYTQATNLKHTVGKAQKFNDQVVVKSSASKKKIYSFDIHEGRTNFHAKYRLGSFSRLKVDQKMKVDNAIYYHVSSGKANGWTWHGYTQPYTPKYLVKNIKNINKRVYVKTEYQAKTSHKKVFDFDVIRNHTDFKTKYQLNGFTALKADKQMTVDNAIYYHVVSGKRNGWVWHGYTTTTKPLTNVYLSSEIKQIMDSYHLRGKVLVVNGSQNNRNAEGIGYANYGKRILNSNQNVVYQGASLQKAMTGAMVVQLITASQKTKNPITQNTTINRWYPTLKNAKTITVGNLLTQTSGIAEGNSEADHGYNLSEQQAVKQTVSRVNASKLAGKSFHYNNDNFILLAGIIRADTGQSYATNLQKRIIKPLGLKHTYMWDSVPSSAVKAHSYRYANNKNYQNGLAPNERVLSDTLGAGNVYTTPDDYYAFQRGLQNGKILKYADYQYMTSLKAKSSNGYSGGMYIRHNGNIRTIYGALSRNHIGNWVQLTKNNGQGIIIFTNQSSDEASLKKAGYAILSKISNKFDAY